MRVGAVAVPSRGSARFGSGMPMAWLSGGVWWDEAGGGSWRECVGLRGKERALVGTSRLNQGLVCFERAHAGQTAAGLGGSAFAGASCG